MITKIIVQIQCDGPGCTNTRQEEIATDHGQGDGHPHYAYSMRLAGGQLHQQLAASPWDFPDGKYFCCSAACHQALRQAGVLSA